jgi:polyhydroxybutyrate depolymerase
VLRVLRVLERRTPALIAAVVLLPASALLAQRTETGRMRWDGVERTYTVRVPRSADSARTVPLVIALHGRGGSGQRMLRWSGFDAKADEAGFLLVAPEGTGDPRGWSTGFAPGGAIDDVGFIGALIDTLAARYRVDSKRVYVAGHSNGGVLAHRVASDLSSRVAAAAVVAGAIGARSGAGNVTRIETPRAPVPILIIHGDADAVVPYDAIALSPRGSRPIPAPEAARFWARANECAVTEPQRDTIAAGQVLRDRWERRCRAPVVFLTVRGGDHGWPHTGRGAALNATDAIWDFFATRER